MESSYYLVTLLVILLQGSFLLAANKNLYQNQNVFQVSIRTHQWTRITAICLPSARALTIFLFLLFEFVSLWWLYIIHNCCKHPRGLRARVNFHPYFYPTRIRTIKSDRHFISQTRILHSNKRNKSPLCVI